MGLPEINIVFKTKAAVTAKTADRGTIAVIIKDSGVNAGVFTVYPGDELPSKLTEENAAYLKAALVGNVTAPKKLIVYALASDASDYAAAYAVLGGMNWDYLVLPHDVSSDLAEAAGAWITTQRTDYQRKYKAVLPNVTADKNYIVNLADGIDGNEPAAFAARTAGVICGTPLTQSITYVSVPEAKTCPQRTVKEANDAIEEGKLILIHDGEKVKFGRGVNSMTTLKAEYNTNQWKSIKVVETMDVIKDDMRKLYADNYVGQYTNDYDGKQLLVSATMAYLEELAAKQIVGDAFTVELDVAKTKAYLKTVGRYTEGMTDAEILHANTDGKVFLHGSIQIFDAIEDIDLELGV